MALMENKRQSSFKEGSVFIQYVICMGYLRYMRGIPWKISKPSNILYTAGYCSVVGCYGDVGIIVSAGLE